VTFGVGSAYLEDNPPHYERVPVELQRRYEDDAEFHEWVDETRRKIIVGGGSVTTDAVILALGAVDGAQNEIPARDRVPVETRRRYLNDADFHTLVRVTQKRILAEGASVTTGAVIVVLNALDNAHDVPSLGDVIERKSAGIRTWPAWAQPFRLGCEG